MNRNHAISAYAARSVPYMCGDEPAGEAVELLGESRSLHVWG